MSLGVLNNLSAMYAENNLNNTTNSLNTVLQQLSSGSKINSGADDAAGLSLVDGLQANSQALAQSQTNAQEGVGLLQVADGALSQVTSLLNRAVTLATEASNGTLNSSQDTAANQEYQSILSEINNIGTTTTYNDTSVFGQSSTNIYTGDSSTAGASIDSLNISALSSSNVGDTGGVMAYSNGQNSVFLNLSTSTQNAQSTDTLNSSGSSTIDVNYLVKGANGASTPASTAITVGGSSGYANTANGLISAINDAGLGLTANFTTQGQAGVAGGGSETGIQISGGLISVGVDASTASTSGTLNPSEITNGDLGLGQTITVNVGSTTAATVTIGEGNDTLAGLASAINGAANNGGNASLVTATVVYNSANQATSLQLADSTDTGGTLSVTTTAGNVVPNALSATSVLAADNPVAVQFASSGAGSAGTAGTATLGISGLGSNGGSQLLNGSITLTNGATTETFATGTGNAAGTVYLGASGDNTNTLENLATAITNNLGATATVTNTGISITSSTNGTEISSGASTLTASLAAAVTSNVAGLAASQGTDGSTVIAMTGDAMGLSATSALTSGTHITLKNGSGTATTFTIGNAAAGNGTSSVTTGATTVQGLLNAINANTATNGMSAQLTNGAIVVSSDAVNTSIVASANNLLGTQALSATNASVAPPTNVHSTVNILTATSNPADGSLTANGDTLSGSMTISNNNVTDTFIMGAGSSSGTTFYTGASTLASLQSTITGAANLGVTATLDEPANGTGGSGLTLTANAYGTTIATGGTGITDTSTVGTDAQTSIGNELTNTLSADDSGVLGASVGFSGSFVIGEAGTGLAGGSDNLTVDVGSAAGSNTSANDTATTIYIPGGGTTATMTQIKAAINTFVASATNTGGKNFDFNASVDANTGGLTVQAGAVSTTDTALSIGTSTLVATQTLSAGSVTAGSTAGAAVDTVTNGSTSTISLNDVLAAGGTLTIGNTAGSESTDGNKSVTFTIGGAGATESGDGTNAVTTGVGTGYAGNTMDALVNAINNQSNMDLQASIVDGALSITSDAVAGTGTITVAVGGSLSQAYGVGQTGGVSGGANGTISDTVNAGGGPTAATSASASINTTHGMSIAGTDALAGQLILTNSSNGTAVTFNLNNSAASNGNTVNLTTGNSTLNGLVAAINANTTLGMTASVNSTTGALQVQATATDTAITVGGTGLTDATSESFSGGVGTEGSALQYATNTISLAGVGNTIAGTQTLTGQLTIAANGVTKTFVMGGTAGTSGNTITLGKGTSTVSNLESAILASGLGVAVATNGSGNIVLTSNTANSDAITVTNGVGVNALQDNMGYGPATATLGSYASASDSLTGTLDFNVGSTEYNIGSVSGHTLEQLVNKINSGSYTDSTDNTDPYGVTASLTSGAGGFQTLNLTSNTYGASGDITNGITSGTAISDGGTSATLSYTANSEYSVGISNVATSGVYDSSIISESAPAGVSARYAGLTANTAGSAGIATISYSDGAGQSLSATDLSNQTDAEASLTALNKAITDVAAQDGYIGAQINTLNAVSQVLGTQQENVVSAQNAVQATDYASATSNMSKYEILSQTGISALAQANSMSQEVTKLLQ